MPTKFSICFCLAALHATLTFAWWQPTAGTTWQITLSHVLQPPYISPAGNSNVTALDSDLFDNANAKTWAIVKAAGYKTICYFSAGSYEDWRPDADDFLPADLGAQLDGWPGERWLDTNSANVRTIMGRRMDLAVKQGCDAIDPDNIDAYDNDGGGLNLTTSDAIDYVRFLANEGHQRGLAVGLKNGGTILPNVLNVTNFEVNEQCLQYDECATFQPFIEAGKPVFEIEYTKKDTDNPSRMSTYAKNVCTAPSRQGFSTLLKHMSLDDWAVICASSSGSTTLANSTSASSTSTVSATPSTSTSAGMHHYGGHGAPVVATAVGVSCAVGWCAFGL